MKRNIVRVFCNVSNSNIVPNVYNKNVSAEKDCPHKNGQEMYICRQCEMCLPDRSR